RVAALEQRQRELVADLALDDPLERPGAEGRLVPGPGQPGPGIRRDLELETALGQPPAQVVELDLDDALNVGLAERAKADDLVDAVDELGLEEVVRLARQ